jgi:transcriptional regulator with XRE-family HTH domain
VHSLDVAGIRRRLGANVRRIRLAAKLTQVQASERAGLELRHFQKIETADANPTLTSIVRVAFGLNVDISVLFKALPRTLPQR